MATILVTAAGGDLGQAIVKALRAAPYPHTLAGADLLDRSPGQTFVDEWLTLPRADAPGYLEALDDAARVSGASAVVPASEHELRVAPDRLPSSGAVVVAQPAAQLTRHLDKLASLRSVGDAVPLAPFADGADEAAVEEVLAASGFPVVVKPRHSSGSRSVVLAADRDMLADALSTIAAPLVQGYLDDQGGEYSVGVFRWPGGERALAFRRGFRPGIGLSWWAETVDEPEVAEYALAVARATSLEGSVNVQLRVTHAGPRLLEINPRFSSLAAARAAAGFHDVAWSVAVALGEPLPELPATFRNLRFERYFAEVIDFGDGFTAVPEWIPAATVVG
jgi:carbamoyl-phosphate synthase large subunit